MRLAGKHKASTAQYAKYKHSLQSDSAEVKTTRPGPWSANFFLGIFIHHILPNLSIFKAACLTTADCPTADYSFPDRNDRPGRVTGIASRLIGRGPREIF